MNIDEKLKMIESALKISSYLIEKINNGNIFYNTMFLVNDMKFRLNSDKLHNCVIDYYSIYDNDFDYFINVSLMEYINLFIEEKICLSFQPHAENYKKYSFLNNPDPKLYESECIIDEYTYDGRIMTEEEHFQSSLIMPDLPDYNTLLKGLSFMKDSKTSYGSKLNSKSFMYYYHDGITLEVMEELKRKIELEFGTEEEKSNE